MHRTRVKRMAYLWSTWTIRTRHLEIISTVTLFRWLASDQDDGAIERVLTAQGSHMLASEYLWSHMLASEYLWSQMLASVFWKRSKMTLIRVQGLEMYRLLVPLLGQMPYIKLIFIMYFLSYFKCMGICYYINMSLQYSSYDISHLCEDRECEVGGDRCQRSLEDVWNKRGHGRTAAPQLRDIQQQVWKSSNRLV